MRDLRIERVVRVDWIKRLEDVTKARGVLLENWMDLLEVLLVKCEAGAVVKIVVWNEIPQLKRATRARGRL